MSDPYLVNALATVMYNTYVSQAYATSSFNEPYPRIHVNAGLQPYYLSDAQTSRPTYQTHQTNNNNGYVSLNYRGKEKNVIVDPIPSGPNHVPLPDWKIKMGY
ncbi:hypothetical protein ma393 [Moumouvirus australiensis]|uniref:Uncharacterized protein n=1 Tax=Moumouvirus australiensis TaxID=2109587 RepID=A0A2P1ELM4_9VIRU|nr:hypothetical protein QKC55_gp512 [Moumouvirus australiensis]AVL94779.1 hypothetical protein ma393 [Moumouvirus australiensis]